MQDSDCGQIIVPTGGGKTYIMIQDCINDVNSELTVIVAPRILLAQQLCDDFIQLMGDKVSPNLNMFHTHSGRTKHLSSTKPEEIKAWVDNTPNRKLLFTTYHSLSKVVDSGINIDTIYYDEAHNGTAKSFNISVSACKQIASRCYYFTATPKISYKHDRGMNNVNIWGEILHEVDARDLIKCGAIIPPNVQSFPVDLHYSKYNAHAHHSLTVQSFIKSITNYDGAKVLISVPSSRILNKMIGQTKLISQLKELGYDVLHITSKYGAYVNQTKVNRTSFFNTLKEWGCETARKFVIFHYSILSEGINISGLSHTLLLRNLNIVEMSQTIGRVIRLHKEDQQNIFKGLIPAGVVSLYRKSSGNCVIPTHKNYGTKTINRIQRITNDIFTEGHHTTAYC
jgi:superfamily II DNA or RNA helicase